MPAEGLVVGRGPTCKSRSVSHVQRCSTKGEGEVGEWETNERHGLQARSPLCELPAILAHSLALLDARPPILPPLPPSNLPGNVGHRRTHYALPFHTHTHVAHPFASASPTSLYDSRAHTPLPSPRLTSAATHRSGLVDRTSPAPGPFIYSSTCFAGYRSPHKSASLPGPSSSLYVVPRTLPTLTSAHTRRVVHLRARLALQPLLDPPTIPEDRPPTPLSPTLRTAGAVRRRPACMTPPSTFRPPLSPSQPASPVSLRLSLPVLPLQLLPGLSRLLHA
ncbi:uncharacterized protein B0H18DRAFT_1131074 [Fomitopsis serialis]|uniref:uncharacterized protein n=1 Tax=Fomitopsis serialis TaxID=139415 RepID=UPI0020083D23|nr:uncharacterized protein B0H18DRAFT_1131074 [Neoantrodia serialis]KAH9908819.1 hypothetical protein B0H18DRAFT_1131074 [Neoantrodia serialis]